MAKGFKHGAGGVGLNFKVVGNPQPANPKENTIWVNTDDAITSWIFSATEPEAPVEGMVWLITYTYSPGAFNAVKKNGIQVYPVGAKQYISGAWVNKPAKIYHGNAWVDLFTYLYNAGDQFKNLTGGFVTRKIAYGPNSPTLGDITTNDDGTAMYIKMAVNNAGCQLTTSKKISLSGFSKLHFDGLMTGGAHHHLCIWSKFGSYITENIVAQMNKDGVDGIHTIDVSGLNGEYYIGFLFYDETCRVTMRSLWLER